MSHASELIEKDIEAYLKQHENKDLLRFLTCGSVDDGKSTLIGRLLYDSKLIYEDQMAAIENDSKKFNTTNEDFDLALLVDGLQSEREQGITIDVAYRYFSTDKRKFIIADTPGHEQYTRNMATGASTADLAILMIDARRGVLTQTRRHSYIASLLGIKHLVVAINKMDIVDYSEQVFNEIKAEYQELVTQLKLEDVQFVPMSALKGDNVVNVSDKMPWYTGETLMQMLENVEISQDKNYDDFRMPVQYVNRPNLDFRGFCGTIAAGVVKPGDSVTVLPAGKSSTVKSIVTYDGEIDEAYAGDAITLTLNDEIDISRGDLLVHTGQLPTVTSKLQANVVWMGEQAMQTNKEYSFKFAAKSVNGFVSNIVSEIDVNTLKVTDNAGDVNELALNGIALCNLDLNEAIALDTYDNVQQTGAFIVIDRLTNVTVGAGMVSELQTQSSDSAKPSRNYTDAEIALNKYVREHFPEWGCKAL